MYYNLRLFHIRYETLLKYLDNNSFIERLQKNMRYIKYIFIYFRYFNEFFEHECMKLY